MTKHIYTLIIIFGALILGLIAFGGRKNSSILQKRDIPSPHSVVQEPVEPTSTGSISTTPTHEIKTSVSGRILDIWGKGVSGATVLAFPATRSLRRCCMSAPTTPMTKSDNNGDFSFSDIHPGVELVAFKGASSLISRVVETAGPHILTFPQGKFLVGVAHDSEGNLVTNATFRTYVRPNRAAALQMGSAVESHSKKDGSFKIGPIAPGTSVLLEGTASGYCSVRTTVTIEEGAPLDPLSLLFERGKRLIGSIATSDGTPLPNVQLTARQKNGVLVEVQSSSTGEFEISGLKEGETQIVAKLPGFVSTSVSVFGTEGSLQIELHKAQSIDGHIIPAQTGLYAVVVNGGSRYRTPIAPDGSFHLSDLSGGSIKILIESEDRNILSSRQIDLHKNLTNLSITVK